MSERPPSPMHHTALSFELAALAALGVLMAAYLAVQQGLQQTELLARLVEALVEALVEVMVAVLVVVLLAVSLAVLPPLLLGGIPAFVILLCSHVGPPCPTSHTRLTSTGQHVLSHSGLRSHLGLRDPVGQ
jgi:hypothetical protein